DEQSMETVVLDLLRRRGLTVAAAETISGGTLSARMSAADTAMETFRGARIAHETKAAAGPPEQRAAAAAAQVRAEFGTRVGLAAVAPEAAEGYGPGCVFLCADIEGNQQTEK